MLGKAVVSLALVVCTAGQALASQPNGLELSTTLRFDQKFIQMLDKAQRALDKSSRFEGLFDDSEISYTAEQAVGNEISTTIKFSQTYKGLEVIGEEALVHFDPSGSLHDTTGSGLATALSVEPTLSAAEAHQLLMDRFQDRVKLSEPAKLKVFTDFNETPRLVYHMLTSTSATHDGHEVYVDAHNGAIVLEFPRAYHGRRDEGHRRADQTVYRADTEEARKPGRIDRGSGAPRDIDFEWYVKVIEDGQISDAADESSVRAAKNAQSVYQYYWETFKRRSYDDQDSRLVSVVHVGKDWNNAFWTTEYKFMGYGDGDGEKFIDLTHGLDVAAHEMTHGVTAHSARLVYAAEPGALNESYSDFFAKMVDYDSGNWLIGHTIVGEKLGARAIRNMLNPEEFRQPPDNESPRKIPTDGFCWSGNDYCGVHRNSGIPNRAAALIVEAIGKEKTERMYYTVLTQRLRARSGFSCARYQTEAVCGQMFGADASECAAVREAFDTVKIPDQGEEACGSKSEDEDKEEVWFK